MEETDEIIEETKDETEWEKLQNLINKNHSEMLERLTVLEANHNQPEQPEQPEIVEAEQTETVEAQPLEAIVLNSSTVTETNNQNADVVDREKTQTRKQARQAKKSSKKREVDSDKAAKFLIARFEKFSSMLLDKNTDLTEEETFLIQPSLSGLLEDMDMGVVEKYSKFMNPLVLLFGLGMWYIRVMPRPAIQKDQNIDNKNASVYEDESGTLIIERTFSNENPYLNVVSR